MDRRRLIQAGAAGLALLHLQGCWALMIKGSPKKNPRGDEIMWGFVVMDIFLGVWLYPIPIPVSLLIDFGTRAIYRPLDGPRLDDLDSDFDDLDESETESRLEVDPLELCPIATASLEGLQPRRLGRWAREFRDHVETCPHCMAALTAIVPSERLPAPLKLKPEAVIKHIEVDASTMDPGEHAALRRISADQRAFMARVDIVDESVSSG